MRSFFLISIISIAVATPALATDFFVGAGVGWQQDEIKRTLDKDSESVHFQVRTGAILEEHHRITAAYSYKDDDVRTDDQKYKHYMHLMTLSYDYMLPFAFDGRLSGFIGPTMGLYNNEFADRRRTHFTWGGQVGLQYRLPQNWSVDLSYRYLDMDVNGSQYELDTTQQVTLAFDRRF
ncbi:porin family protein [Photobacterium sp. DNB23_23_1]